jgi:hypothetical protein
MRRLSPVGKTLAWIGVLALVGVVCLAFLAFVGASF